MKPRDLAAFLFFAFSGSVANAGALLTDATVFSANEIGRNYLSLIWNTQGQPPDGPNRWNLYVSSSTNFASPVFVNGFNDGRARIGIDLTTPGTYSFTLFAESVRLSPDPALHFVLNLYFGGDQTTPRISGLYGPMCLVVCPAGDFNGLDIFGNSFAQEAGTLSSIEDGLMVALTEFTWMTDTDQTMIDTVWPHWHNAAPFSGGSGTRDFIGQFTLTVSAVPEPGTLLLVGLALAGLAVMRRHRDAGASSPSG